MTEAKMPGFRDIDEASERIRALTRPLVPFEWVQDRAEVFARFGQAMAIAQILEAELRVTISLVEDNATGTSDDVRIKPRTLGTLAKMLRELVDDGEKDTQYFHEELARIVGERNALAHDLFRTRLFTETPNSNVDDLGDEKGRRRLIARLGAATGDFAYMAVLMSELTDALNP